MFSVPSPNVHIILAFPVPVTRWSRCFALRLQSRIADGERIVDYKGERCCRQHEDGSTDGPSAPGITVAVVVVVVVAAAGIDGWAPEVGIVEQQGHTQWQTALEESA